MTHYVLWDCLSGHPINGYRVSERLPESAIGFAWNVRIHVGREDYLLPSLIEGPALLAVYTKSRISQYNTKRESSTRDQFRECLSVIPQHLAYVHACAPGPRQVRSVRGSLYSRFRNTLPCKPLPCKPGFLLQRSFVPAFRNAEAAVVMERAAFLGISMKHAQPGVDVATLFGNLAAVQQGEAREQRPRTEKRLRSTIVRHSVNAPHGEADSVDIPISNRARSGSLRR